MSKSVFFLQYTVTTDLVQDHCNNSIADIISKYALFSTLNILTAWRCASLPYGPQTEGTSLSLQDKASVLAGRPLFHEPQLALSTSAAAPRNVPPVLTPAG